MITYKYKCLSCTCMFTKDEILEYKCTLCKSQGIERNTVFVCKKCFPRKGKRTTNSQEMMKEKEFYQKIDKLHTEEEHGAVDLY